ncbi:hypothetical protein IKE83_02065 [Candidatus Saccharibacteria bacterium]|nr:hypothetical protein [Candidatus Saccharibacteria bacterium]
MSVWNAVVTYQFARLDNGHRSLGDVEAYTILMLAMMLILAVFVVLFIRFRYLDWKAKNGRRARQLAFSAERVFIRESERLQERLLLELEMRYGERPESVGPEP